MARTETTFDMLVQVARDLDIGFISGSLQPPEAGQIYLGRQTLAEILLPEWADRPLAVGIIAGGPGRERVLTGKSMLNAERLARLEQAVSVAGGQIYQGRLAQLTPADWLRLHGDTAKDVLSEEPPARPGGWQDDPTTAEIAALDTDPVYEAARAAGWPATFANEPTLFLGDQPLYHLLMRENAGRVVTLLIGPLEGSDH
jgi:hypothetical protein